MSNKDLKILCVDDEKDILDIFESLVLSAGFTPLVSLKPTDAIDIFNAEINNIAMVISDFKMVGMTGFDFRRAILPIGLDVPFIIVSGFITKEMALEGLELKIASFCDKPIDQKNFIELIHKESLRRVQYLRECQAIQKIFVEEAAGILDEIEQALLPLEHSKENQELVKIISRGVHTLKGSSGCLDVPTVTKYVHKYEDIIALLLKGQLTFTDDVYEILLVGFDRIKEMIASIPAKTLKNYNLEELLPEITLQSEAQNKVTTQAPVKNTNVALQKQKPKDNISVPIPMLDELSVFSGEITVLRNMTNKIVRSLELRYTSNKDIQNLGELLDEMHKINGTIQTRITDLCKVPLADTLRPLPRMIRDLARELGKKIELHVQGESLRVDNSLAVVCSNSLVHLVRNSADHGIELPHDRLESGKQTTGSVFIKCREDNDEVLITIQDDGRGIDYLKIKAKALEKGLLTEEELSVMSEQQILAIIFMSGFSTAAQITDVSGRGVGMDMVKASVESVGGQIEIDAKPGKGTTFTMHLPIPKSVLIINSLLVESNNRCFAIPQNSILRILRFEREQYPAHIQHVASGTILRSNDVIYPLVNLQTILSVGKNICIKELNSSVVEILIIRSENLFYGLLVDSILDSEEIVVKKVPSYFNIHRIYTGATFMGDGTIGLILDMKGIAELSGIKPLIHPPNLDTPSPHAQSILSEQDQAIQNYLLFNLGQKSVYGVVLDQVFRLEEIEESHIQHCGAEQIVIYRNAIMPLYLLERLLGLSHKENTMQAANAGRIPVIVIQKENGFVGVRVAQLMDIAMTEQEISTTIRDRIGVVGNVFICDQTVTILNLLIVLENLYTKQNGD
ncbi:MAG: chemotaxis protein CheW [Bdellovibrionota bacterium]